MELDSRKIDLGWRVGSMGFCKPELFHVEGGAMVMPTPEDHVIAPQRIKLVFTIL